MIFLSNRVFLLSRGIGRLFRLGELSLSNKGVKDTEELAPEGCNERAGWQAEKNAANGSSDTSGEIRELS